MLEQVETAEFRDTRTWVQNSHARKRKKPRLKN